MLWLEQHWYRISPLHLLLWPLSLLFAAVSSLRRFGYRSGLFAVQRLPVPVIIVGNISIGGTGKTPLVIWLANWLCDRGYQPGIVCRGYRSGGRVPRQVRPDSDPRIAGDEAVLLARRSACPVWAGIDRARTAQTLLIEHPHCNIIISDDGLQHYALARDVEIALIDGERGFGNAMLLPAGPLREPLERHSEIDALIINGGALFPRDTLPPDVPAFDMRLSGRNFYDILNPQRIAAPEDFTARSVHAVAGIGNPNRFFNHLQLLGISFSAHPFPDHHPFEAADLAFALEDAVIMTEKDAVKCERFCNENHWALRVDAEVDEALGELLLRKLKTGRYGH